MGESLGAARRFISSATVIYVAFYAGQYVLLGIQLPFLAGWLDGKGFSPSEIGILTGAALIARLATGPFVAFWADHQHDERLALRLVAAMFAFGACALVFAPAKIFIAAAVVIVTWSFGLLVPLTDTAALRADRNGHLNYGHTRAAASATFVLTTLLGGALLSGAGLGAAPVIMAASGAFALLMSALLPKGVGARGGARPLSWREAPRLIGNPVFVIVMLCAGLIQGAHGVYYAFSFLRWSELGYSSTVIGALWATGVVAEIVVLTRARNIAYRMRPSTLLLLGAAGAAVRWFIIGHEPPLSILFFVQLMHALTFAATYLGTIEFVDRAAPLRLVNTGMTLMSVTGIGALTGAATVWGGFVWDAHGPKAAYLTMSAMGVAAFLVGLVFSRMWRGGKLFE